MKTLHRVMLPLSLVAILVSCSEHEEKPPTFRWERMEFPGHGAVYSISGSLDTVLFVGTARAIFRIRDNGRAIEKVFDVTTPVVEFLHYENEIVGRSWGRQYRSTDGGQTWVVTEGSIEGFRPHEFRNSRGDLIHLASPTNGELGTPTLVLFSTNNGTSWDNIFPEKRDIYSFHVDEQDRMYAGTRGSDWDGLSFVDDPEYRALLYYSVR